MVGADVRSFAGGSVAKVGNSLASSNAAAVGCELETASSGSAIITRARNIDWFASDAVRFLVRRDSSVGKIVVEVIAGVLFIGAGTVVAGRADMENVVPGHGVLDEATAAQAAGR